MQRMCPLPLARAVLDSRFDPRRAVITGCDDATREARIEVERELVRSRRPVTVFRILARAHSEPICVVQWLLGWSWGVLMVVGSRRERIVVELPRGASFRHRRELGAFVRYCVRRIEKDLGPRDRWTVRITELSASGVTCTVAVHQHRGVLETTGRGPDGELAIWDGMCRLEQVLRERRSSIKSSTERAGQDA